MSQTESMSGLVVDRRVSYEDGTLVIFECDALQLIRDEGPNEFLRSTEIEAIVAEMQGEY